MSTVDETKIEEREQERAAEPAPGGDIPVENPATGEVIAHVPDMSPDQVAALVRTARTAQPGWEALGFEGRGRILLRMQKWVVDNSDRIIRTVVSETGKAYE
ncbi:MAG: aldehyde dehydrogenase family protein, partial [Solirubrobacteraceae bacterium]